VQSLFGGCGKIPKPKIRFLEPISQTLLLLQSRSALKSLSVIAYKSWFVELGCVAVAIAIAIFIDQYTKSASPKCVSLNRKSIVLAIPRHGEIDLAQATS
jgi:hypothetical protein